MKLKTTLASGAIATLSAISIAGGVALLVNAGVHIHQSSVEQGKSYLPSAIERWNALPNQRARPSAAIPAGSFLGTISIPSIEKTVNIFQGTTNKELSKGVGHFMQSVMPGASDNSVLAGHRDTVFAHLGQVKVGAQIVVRVQSGTFTYQVDKIRIVSKNDRTVIVPTSSAVLTLSTCFPFVYFGNAPKRYIVSAKLLYAESNSLATSSSFAT